MFMHCIIMINKGLFDWILTSTHRLCTLCTIKTHRLRYCGPTSSWETALQLSVALKSSRKCRPELQYLPDHPVQWHQDIGLRTSEIILIITIIIKRISRAPIHRTRWEQWALYNNTYKTHLPTHAHARAHSRTCARAHTH